MHERDRPRGRVRGEADERCARPARCELDGEEHEVRHDDAEVLDVGRRRQEGRDTQRDREGGGEPAPQEPERGRARDEEERELHAERVVGAPEPDQVPGRPQLLHRLADEAVRGLLAVVAQVVEDERVRREREEDGARHEARRETAAERRQSTPARRQHGEGRDRRREDEPRVDGEPDEQARREPARPPGLDEHERAEREEAREREGLDDREVAEYEPGERVEAGRGERGPAAEAPLDVEVEQRARRRGGERRQAPSRVPRFAEDADPRAVDVRQERHLLVEEVAVGDVAVQGEPRGVRVDALVAVEEPERDERPEDERLRGGDSRATSVRHSPPARAGSGRTRASPRPPPPRGARAGARRPRRGRRAGGAPLRRAA